MDIACENFFLSDLEHPLETDSILEIQKNGVFDHLAKVIGSLSKKTKTTSKLVLTGYPVTKLTYPHLFQIYENVLRRLNCDQVYDLYVDFGYELTAKTFGSGKDGHIIQVNSACLKDLDDDEIAALLGHEIGHIMSNHIQYRELLDSMDYIVKYLPLAGDIVKKKIWSFFAKWIIASEYTADRSSLIASGSLQSVLSLIRKQAGATDDMFTNQQLLQQEVQPIPDNPGIFYMLLTESLPSFGLVSRAQEIVKWSNSEDFKRISPYMHYVGKYFSEYEAVDRNEENLILLHKRAYFGNVLAQVKLGQAYLYKQNTLGFAPKTAISLLKCAAAKGNADAMYLLHLCLKRNVECPKYSQDIQEQLLRASYMRTNITQAESEFSRLTSQHVNQSVLRIVQKYISNQKNITFEVGFGAAEHCISDQDKIAMLESFWIPINQRILAAKYEIIEGIAYGLVLTDVGIYGRCLGDLYAYSITWSSVVTNELTYRNIDDVIIVFCGNRKIYVLNEQPQNSIVELIFKISNQL